MKSTAVKHVILGWWHNLSLELSLLRNANAHYSMIRFILVQVPYTQWPVNSLIHSLHSESSREDAFVEVVCPIWWRRKGAHSYVHAGRIAVWMYRITASSTWGSSSGSGCARPEVPIKLRWGTWTPLFPFSPMLIIAFFSLGITRSYTVAMLASSSAFVLTRMTMN